MPNPQKLPAFRGNRLGGILSLEQGMTRMLTRYAPVLVPLGLAGGVAAGMLLVADPWTAWASAALTAGISFLLFLLLRPKPARPARAPLSMADLDLIDIATIELPVDEPERAEAVLVEAPVAAPEPELELLSPETDAALRATLAELRRLARAA